MSGGINTEYWDNSVFHYLRKDHTFYFLNHFTFLVVMHKDTFNYLLPMYFN